MGVSLSQWRYSIGMFNLKSVYQKHVKVNKNSPSLDQFYDMPSSFAGSVPIKILFGLLNVLAYSSLVISFLFIFLMLYPLFKFLCDETFGFCPYHTSPFAEYFANIFIQISLLPCYISASFRSILSLFKNQLSEKNKKHPVFCFFVTNSVTYIWDSRSQSGAPYVQAKYLFCRLEFR